MPEKSSLPRAVAREKIPDRSLVRDIALARAAREELYAWRRHFFRDEHPGAGFGGRYGRKETGRTGSDDEEIVRVARCEETSLFHEAYVSETAAPVYARAPLRRDTAARPRFSRREPLSKRYRAEYIRFPMNLLSLDAVSKSLGESPLFEDASLGIESGDRIGFVGRNGCGKSTFMRILAGALEPDSGGIARKRGLSFSFLEQRHTPAEGETLGGFLYRGQATAMGRLAARRALLDAKDRDHEAVSRLDAEIEAMGAGGTERAYASLCTELGLPSLDAPLSAFSGGMVKKAAIARALAPGAELLFWTSRPITSISRPSNGSSDVFCREVRPSSSSPTTEPSSTRSAPRSWK